MVAHATYLRGLGGDGAAPLLLKRSDEDFVDGVLRELRDPALAALLATRANDRDNRRTLRLFQPVHRVYHLALFEAACAMPGAPRLDPDKIDSSGMVVRRTASSLGSGMFGEGWMTGPRGPVGWRKLASLEAARLDPDPAQRRLPDQGNALINQKLAEVVNRDGVYGEEILPLYVAPPDVCAAAGRTVLFGLIPTTSAETGDAPPLEQPYDDGDIANQVPRFFKAGKAVSIDRIAGRAFTYESAERTTRGSGHEFSDAASPPLDDVRDSDTTSVRTAKQMHGFLGMLKVLAIQLDAFSGAPDAKKLRDALSAITLELPGGRTESADRYLSRAADVLVMSPGSGASVALPTTWPELTNRTADAIKSAFGKILQARFAAFTPRATRFDDPNARFRVEAFIRVQRDDGCAPELVWSPPSEPYAVAPWFDNSSTPPVLVRLPPLDRNNIKKLKPNVAFVVPKNLFNILSCNSPEDLAAGKGKDCGSFGIDWICGFNIPIITLCAFIVLNIFLSLFNIIFFWLPFIKICFPLPAKLKELASPEES
jgi:hypothetical protein